MVQFEEWQKTQKVVLIDGAMSTGLEELGMDLNDPMWTAKALLEDPEKIVTVHKNYFDSGANIAITSSYQASVLGFKQLGYSVEESKLLIKKTIELAKLGREQSNGVQEKWVAGSVGPYGAFLADGSEYRGNYGLSKEELISFHQERITSLIEAGADLLACETIPDKTEIEALIELLKNLNAPPAFLTVSMRDAEHLSDGTKLSEFQKIAESSNQIFAYGVNCVDPDWVSPILEQLNLNASKPLVVYPNSGEEYDPVTKEWTHEKDTEHLFSIEAKKWHDLGAKFIGGCCCTTCREIKVLKETFLNKN